MNKKRIALALAAGLSLNTLAVTVAPIGRQAEIAHAVQSSGRLTTQEDEARRKAINIKQLDTIATNLANGDVEVTFKNIKTEDIKTVTATEFKQDKFTERKDIDGNNLPVTPTWTNGKLIFKGIKEAGIYTGTVTIEYKTGDKETYTLSLTKKVSDTFEIEKIDVTAGAIKVSDVKFNGQALKDNETLYLVEKGGSVTSTTPKATYTSASGAVFNSGIKFEEGKVYEVVYQYAGGLHEVAAQVMLVKEAPKFSAYASNSTSFEADLKSQVESDFMASATISGTKPSALGVGDFTVDVTGVGTVTKYSQTYSGSYLGGVAITPSFDSTGGLTVTLGTARTTGANFVPAINLGYGENTTNSTGLVGNYIVNVGNGNDVSYFDASSHVIDVKAMVTGTKAILNVNSISTDFTKLDLTDIKLSGSDTDKILNLNHGYSSVGVEFKVKDSNFGGKSFADWETEVVNLVTSAVTTSVKPTLSTINNTASNIVSIVVSKDALEDVVISADFVRTSESTGELVVKNGQKLFPANFNPNDVVSKLNIPGAKISLIADGSTTDFRFSVEYNGNLPSTIDWTFTVDNKDLVSTVSTFGGKLETDKGMVEVVNFDKAVTTSNTNTNTIQNQFEIVAGFGNAVPSGATLGFENQNNLRVTFKDLGTQNKTIKATVGSGSKYQGVYSAGIWVTQQPMGLQVTKAESTESGRVNLTIDASFFNVDDYKNVSGAKIEYREKVGANETPKAWVDSKVAFTITGNNSDIKEDAITKSVTGLTANKEYEFRVIYDYKDGNDTVPVTSNVVTVKVSNNTSGSSGIVSGGSGSTTIGTSVGSTTITSTSSNTTSDSDTVNITLPSGVNYDSTKTPVAVKFTYKGLDGKTVTENKEQYSNVVAKFENGKIVVDGLVPGKDYPEISVDYTDNNGRTRTLILKDVKTTTTTELEKYLADVYTTVFKRPADEAGYHFHLNNLKDKKVSLREFLKNMLNEKEFNENYKTPETKVEALYAAIVARTPDQAGKDFWVNEYKKAVTTYGSEALALQAIVDRMVNEAELKTLAEKMNVQW